MKSPEELGGWNTRSMVSVPFGWIVCLAGAFETVNGRIGAENPVTLMAAGETFVNVIGMGVEAEPPISSGVKLASSGEMVNEAVGVSPCPVKVIVEAAPVMLAVSVPGFAPRAGGWKVTGTVIDWPVDNVAGSVSLGAPMEKLLEYHPNDDTVVGELAV